jgi:hypothetical protein
LNSQMKNGNFDFVISDNANVEPGIKSILLGHEKNVLVEARDYSGEEYFLDHDRYDRTTVEYFRNDEIHSLQPRYMGDIFGILEGIKFGYGRAVIPKHLLKNEENMRIVNPKKQLKIPVVLHFNEQLERIEFFADAIQYLKQGFQKHLD